MPGRRPRLSPDASAAQRKASESSVGAVPVASLYRGRARLQLIRDLAMGEWSHASIAQRFGVDTSDITAFAETYANDIAEVVQAMAGQMAVEAAGLWIAKKQNRLAELQSDFEETGEVLKAMRDGTYRPTDNDGTNLGSRRHRALLKTRMDILRTVADELSPRGAASGVGAPDDPNVVHYVIDVGNASEALR